jgi:integrase
MQLQQVEDKIERFLERKFRVSRSYSTKLTYRSHIVRFGEFTRIRYNLDINQLLGQIDAKKLDPIVVLDEYYTFLTQYKHKDKIGFSNATILQYVITAKEFLNSEGCKIYSEDLRQKFRLPKIIRAYEKGLTKETINRILRLANPKLAAVILIACSSGMRIAEIVQLRLSDIDFSGNLTTIVVRAVTTKTRETRVTHISSEATNALKDYLSKQSFPKTNDDYIFLIQYEDRLRNLKERLAKNEYCEPGFRVSDEKRLENLKQQLVDLPKEERLANSIRVSRENLEKQLSNIIKDIPDLNRKNDNGRYSIHFHAFRAWFKTQVTDAHQSDFAEALMGHKSLKLIYYRQNDKARAETYLGIEHALTIADTEKIDKNYTDLQKDNLELRGIVDSLSRQLRNLEKKISDNF